MAPALLSISLLVNGLVASHAHEIAISTKEITAYPFVAPPTRVARIVEGYKRIGPGLLPAEVMNILGEPDEVRPLYAPNIAKGEIVGYTHWYVIRRLVRSGSVNEKQEACVRVSYGLDDRVMRIDGWGLAGL